MQWKMSVPNFMNISGVHVWKQLYIIYFLIQASVSKSLFGSQCSCQAFDKH